MAIVRNGPAGGQENAAWVLGDLADNDPICTAIIEAGGVEALVALLLNGSDRCKSNAKWALTELPIAEYVSRLRSENASLKRQLAGDDVVDLRDGDASPPAKKRNALRDAHDEQQSSTLNRVKKEKADAEGARDRTDAVAAAASADLAGAASELEDAQELAGHLYQSENNKMSTIDELRGTVSERDARIEALEAEAREKDATIAELRERVGQLERPAPRGGGRAKRPRT